MAQGPSDTILVAIRITLRIRESKVRNPDHPDRRRFVLCECILVRTVDNLSAGVFAAITLSVHVKYTRDRWTTWSNYLRALMLLGCLGQLAAVCAFAVYLTLAISQHQGSSSIHPHWRIQELQC